MMSVPTIKPDHDADTKLIEYINIIANHSKHQIDAAFSAYKLVAGLIAAIFIVGTGLFVYITQKSVDDMNTHLNNEVHAMWTDVNNKVQERLDKEFEAPHIRELIVDTDTNRVNKDATAIITTRVNALIDNKLQPVEHRLERVNRNIEYIANINSLACEAKLCNYSSYVDLVNLSSDKTKQVSSLADLSVKELDYYFVNIKYGIYRYIYS